MTSTDIPLWIDGRRRSASDGATFDVNNPHSGKVVHKSASASAQDCADAVEAARKAFQSWENTPPPVKRDIFLKAAELIQTEKYIAKIKKLLQDETAAVEKVVAMNTFSSVGFFREAAGLATQVKGTTFPSSSVPGAHIIVQRRAHGVVLSIAPWNAPVALALRAVAIPLICGNTVVLKSSEYSPGSQEVVVELLHEAGLPKGCLNYLSMSRENSPRLVADLIANPTIRHINFTGSDRVGRILAGEAAKYLKPCVFELGGKSPAVVLDDANIDEAAEAIVFGALLHSGQICMSTERVIVQRRASEKLIPKITSLCSNLRAGDPITDPSTQLSALFSPGSAEGVVQMIKEAEEQGAQLLVGDKARDGAVVQPHVVVGVKPGMKAWDRESFGPVIGITEVDTVDEAIELANASDYSLVASLWTSDLNVGLEAGARIRAGSTAINGPTIQSELALGHAGLGGATGYGRFDIEHFTIERSIAVNPPGGKCSLV